MNFRHHIPTLILIFSIVFAMRIGHATPTVEFAQSPLDLCPTCFTQAVPDVATNDSKGNNLQLFQASYAANSWSGYLKKYSITFAADGSTNISTLPLWEAGEILTHQAIPTARKIYTYDPATKNTIPFSYNTLPVATRATFDLAADHAGNDGLGSMRVDYLYGDRQREQNTREDQSATFRKRESILGDIVNSAPLYVGGASNNIVGAGYAKFYTEFKNRPGTIYVGANDGMLHAFSADSGVELFAYIPSPLLNKLPALTYPTYRHEPFMDGKIIVKAAQISGTWRTVLAAGMGGGGKGVFALDVTKPGDFATGQRALFEFTEKDDADIGYILAQPAIIKIQTNQDDRNGENFLAFPNGYNAANSQGDTFLFLLSLNKNFSTPWTLNKDYYKLKVTPQNHAAANALTSPGLVIDVSGNTQYAYSGDLQGNIWRFDFSKGERPDSTKPVSIFNAVDSKQASQPITAAPLVSYTPDDSYLILFGTGKYIEIADTNPAHFQTNSFYAIADNKAAAKDSYFITDRSKLARRQLSASYSNEKNGFKITGDDFAYGDGITANTKKGWYLDFTSSESTGERSVSTALIANDSIYFNTFTPSRSGAPQSRAYTLNLFSGKTLAQESLTGRESNLGMTGTPILILNKTELGEPDAIGQRENNQHLSIMNFGTNNAGKLTVTIDPINAKQVGGRLSWREIQNWQDLKK